MKERGGLERFNLKLPATVTAASHVNDEGVQVQTVATENICSGGAFFRTLTPFFKGTRVKIEVVLDPPAAISSGRKGAIVRVNGEVLRSNSVGVAVRFDQKYRLLPQPLQ